MEILAPARLTGNFDERGAFDYRAALQQQGIDRDPDPDTTANSG
jgi:hypothetical protein